MRCCVPPGPSPPSPFQRQIKSTFSDPNLDAADRFCTLYAGACAALAWWFNRDRELYHPGWLDGVLAYVTGGAALPALECVEGMAAAGRLFTALPVRLAEAPPTRSNGDAR